MLLLTLFLLSTVALSASATTTEYSIVVASSSSANYGDSFNTLSPSAGSQQLIVTTLIPPSPVISITTSNGATVCPARLGGTWITVSPADTCTISGTFTLGGGLTLDVGSGVTVMATGGLGLGGLDNYGTINNYGTMFGTGSAGIVNEAGGLIRDYGGMTGGGASGNPSAPGGTGVVNEAGGTIRNAGTLNGQGGPGAQGAPSLPGGPGGPGIKNVGTIINNGTVDGLGGFGGAGGAAGTGIAPGGVGGAGINNTYGTISNNETTTGLGGMGGPGGPGGPGIYNNSGTINNYCGATLLSNDVSFPPNNSYACYALTFKQSGISSGATWGVTVTWLFGQTHHTGSGTSLAVSNLEGPITYSYDSPITASGITYDCTAGCSGTVSVTGDTSVSATYFAVTTTSVSCSPSRVAAGSRTQCTATVSGASGSVSGETITWSGSGTGQASAPSACVLSGTACSIQLDAVLPGNISLKASYPGDSDNLPSSGDALLPVTLATLSLTPSQGPPGGPSSVVVLSGTQLSSSYTYLYCLEAGVTVAYQAPCPNTGPSFTTDSSGNIPPGVSMAQPSGNGVVIVYDPSTSIIVAWAPFVVTTPTIVLTPSQGLPGTSVSVNGSGFSIDTTIGTFAYGTTPPSGITQTCTEQTTSSTGSFSCKFTVPSSSGSVTVTIAGSDVSSVPADEANAAFQTAYSATFSQTGIPSTATWGVSVGGTEHTGTGSSIVVSGLSGTVSYTYDSTVNGAGVNYVCATGCTGSVSSSAAAPSASYSVQYVPSLSTALSSSAITVGQSANDSATLTGASGTAGGTVTYYYYSGASCGGTGTQVGTAVTVTDGSVPVSSPQAFASAGSFSWKAVYSGDSNDLTATSQCETLTVSKASPAISTALSSSTVAVGTSTTDVSTISGGFSPTGTVTFTVYSDSACTQAVSGYSSSVAVSNGDGQYTSGKFAPTSPGAYYWAANYTGDSNNSPASSACNAAGESLTVTKASPTVSTSASPAAVAFGSSSSDTATVSGGYDPTGTVTYSVFSDSACNNPVAGYSPSAVTVGGNGQAPASASFTASAVGEYYWQAVYSGDSNNNGFTTPCGATGETLTVNARSTALAISCPPTAVNEQTDCTVTVTDTDTGPAVTPTGTVDAFSDGGAGGVFNATSCALASGRCGFTYTPAPGSVGKQVSISAEYGGDAVHDGSTGGTSLTPTKRAASLTVACPATPAGVATTCTATVTDSNAGTPITPTGTVDAFSDAGAGGTFGSTSCTLSAGSCTFAYTPPMSAAGTNITISAVYEGDSAHFTSTQSASLSVMTPEQAMQALIGTIDGMNLPRGVTQHLDSQVNQALRDLQHGDARGAITVLDRLVSELGGNAYNGGSSHSGHGEHGGLGIPASDSQTIITQLQGIVGSLTSTTTTAVACSPTSTQAGSSVRCTVTVTGDQPGGMVNFTSSSSTGSFGGPGDHGSGRQSTSCQLGDSHGRGDGRSNQTQSCAIRYADTSAGTFTISANYTGDFADYPSANATSVTFTRAATTTTVSCQPREAWVGQNTTCTAFVRGGNGSPTGTVAWTSNSTAGTFVPSSATCTLAAGDQGRDQGDGNGRGLSCSVQYVASSPGAVNVTAAYSGDQNNLPSTGSSLALIRPPPQSSTRVDCQRPRVDKSGFTVTCEVTVSGTDPAGQVTFSTNSTTGSFSSATCTIGSGGHGDGGTSCSVTYTDTSTTSPVIITASYSGDAQNLPSTGSTVIALRR